MSTASPPNPEALRFALLNRFLKNQAKIPQMPEAALRIRKLLGDERCSLEQLARVINSDPPLAAYLMQFAESPLLRGARPCSTMRDVLARLGTRQINSLVTGFTVRNMFISKEAALQRAFRARWQAALERAAYCAALAQYAQGLAVDEAMLAGLLQDIGSLPLLAELERWPDYPRDTASLWQLCEQLSGDLGALILTRWQLPSAVIACAKHRLNTQRSHEGAVDLLDLCLTAQYLQKEDSLDNTRQLPALVKLHQHNPTLAEERTALREQLKDEVSLWLKLLGGKSLAR